MKKLALAAILLLTASCASQKNKEVLTKAEKKYYVSLKHNTVTCKGTASCRKAFELTEGYIQTNSNTPIRHVDDTTISTDAPEDPVEVGMLASMTPGTGETATITITVQCVGLASEVNKADAAKSWKPLCLKRATSIYDGYKPYVDMHINE